jgi:hypothetical protein
MNNFGADCTLNFVAVGVIFLNYGKNMVKL